MINLYTYLLSDIYLFISFFIFFLLSIFCNLNKEYNFPNIYKFTCVIIFIFLLNVIIIDNQDFVNHINSYDLFKIDTDILVKWIIIVFSLFFFCYSYFYIKKSKLHLFEYSLTIFFIILSFSFFISVIDLLSFYLLLEIQSLCFYLLTAFNKHNQYSVESGLKYFILSSFSSVSLLYGYSFLYGITGSLNFFDIFLFFSNISSDFYFVYSYYISCILILVAFLFKLYIAPFHLWVGDIYQGAPSISTAFFATITSFPLFYIFIKFFFNIFYWIQPFFIYFFFILSISSMLLGLFSALYQKKIKRLIAFSSVSNIGYLLIAFIQENPQSFSYSIIYFILYMINVTGLFIIFLNLYISKASFFLERFTLLSGLINKNKILSLSLIILFFTAAGIPPFPLFLAKILILVGVSYNFYSVLLFILVFSAIVGGFYYLRIIKYMSFDIKNNWIYLSNFNYISTLMLLYIIFVNLFFWYKGSFFTILSDYLIIGLI